MARSARSHELTREAPYEQSLKWIIQLRWVATLGQALVIAWVELFLELRAPLKALSVVICVAALSNLIVQRLVSASAARPAWVERLWMKAPWGVFTLVSLDLLTLTLLLLLTGGPYNPFSFLYLIHITLATVTLPPRFTWAVMVESLGSMALLFVGYERGSLGRFVEQLSGVSPPTGAPHAHHAHHMMEPRAVEVMSGGGMSLIEQLMQLHVEGMWVACALGGVMIVYFTQRIQRDADEVRRALREAERRAAEAERFGALTTLTAGAAHELATPLASIALACDEGLASQGERGEDRRIEREALELIQGEARRCVGVLEQLRGLGARADLSLKLSLAELIEDVISAYQEEERSPLPVEVRWLEPDERSLKGALGEALIEGPILGLIQGLKNLLQNAHQATLHNAQAPLPSEHDILTSPLLIELKGERGESQARAVISVIDYAGALDEASLHKIGEPFYTTRDVGEGLGLGVYLLKQLVSYMEGTLHYELRVTPSGARCTCAHLTLPVTHP